MIENAQSTTVKHSTGLVRVWVWLHLLTIMAMLLQPSTPPTYLNRYSLTAISVLTGLIILLPIVWLGTQWLLQHNSTDVLPAKWHKILTSVICLISIVLAIKLSLSSSTNSYILIGLYFVFISTALLIWITEGSPNIIDIRLTSRLTTVVCLLCGVATLLLATRIPYFEWNDEGFMFSVALAFARYHRLFVQIYTPLGSEYLSFVNIVKGFAFGLFGASFDIGRVVIMLFSLGGLIALFATIRREYSTLVACCVILLGLPAVLVLNFSRPDPSVALYLSLALFFYIVAEKSGRLRFHLLVGFFVGFSIDGHPNAYRFGIGFALAYLIEYLLLIQQRRRFLIYWPFVYLGIGGLLGVALYIGIYAALNPTLTSFRNFVAPTNNADVYFQLNFSSLLRTTSMQFDTALQHAPLLFVAALVGMWSMRTTLSKIERLAIVVLLVNTVILSVFFWFRVYYLSHLIPILGILAAGGFHRLFKSLSEKPKPQASYVIFIVILIASISTIAVYATTPSGQDYRSMLKVGKTIRTVLPENISVVGIDPLYIEMYNYKWFYTTPIGILYAQKHNISEKEAWASIDPDAIVIADEYPWPTPEALIHYIDENSYVRIRCWDKTAAGRIEIYVHPRLENQVQTIRECVPFSEISQIR